MITKRIWRIFWITLVIALPVRLYQTLFLLEADTGFYTDGYLTTAIVFIALMVGCLLLYADTARSPAPVSELPLQSLPAAVMAMFTGFLFCGQSLFSLLGVPSVENTVMNGILAAAGILAGIILLVQAYGHAVGKNFWRDHPLPALLPPLWGCVCLVALFITYSGSVNIAENVYDTFSVVFLLLFFFAYAKLHAGIEPERSARDAVRFGLMAIQFAVVTVVPELVLRVMGVSPVTSYPFGMYLMNGVAALFVFFFLLALHRAKPVSLPAQDEDGGESDEGEEDDPGDETQDFADRLNEAYGATETFLPREKSPFPKNNSENDR